MMVLRGGNTVNEIRTLAEKIGKTGLNQTESFPKAHARKGKEDKGRRNKNMQTFNEIPISVEHFIRDIRKTTEQCVPLF